MDWIPAKLMATLLYGTLPVVVLVAKGPLRHGSWWYPNPERRDYPFKLRLYAILDVNTPSQPPARWFVRLITLTVLIGGLPCIWGQHFFK